MPGRTIAGLPVWGWAAAVGVGVLGFLWYRKRATSSAGASSPATAAKGGSANSFTQAQEVEDFQVFSALTGAQQASDLNFLSEVAGLFAGGSSTAATSANTGAPASGSSTSASAIPSPPSTGTVYPTVIAASQT